MNQRRENGKCFYMYPATLTSSKWSNMRFVNYKPTVPKYNLFNLGPKTDPTTKPVSKEKDDPDYQKRTECDIANLNSGTIRLEKMILSSFNSMNDIKLSDNTNFDLMKEFSDIWDHIDPGDTKVTVERKLIITTSKDSEPEESIWELFLLKLRNLCLFRL